MERCALRPGNVHSADGWRAVLEPVIARYRGTVNRLYFRGDAAFANHEIYEFIEAEGIGYAIRLPANSVLQDRIGYLLKRPVGRPPLEVCRYYASFSYQAQSWKKPRRPGHDRQRRRVNRQSVVDPGIIGSEHVHMAYNASKAAVRLMTKSVAVQHAKDKIRANSVHPGIMPPMRTSGRTAEPAVRAERMRVIPMRRPGEVDEVAYAILFLASDESSYITGSEIHVGGGAIAI